MCELDDLGGFARRPQGLTRRGFGKMAVGAGLAATLPRLASAVEVKGQDLDIKTADGTADAYFVHPAGGRHPAVLIWPDIMGLRPAFRDMAKRLAESGYSVLVINPFYRTKRAPTSPPKVDFTDKATMSALMALKDTLNANTAAVDSKAFIGWLDRQPSVDTEKKAGTTGYCMGGPLVMRTAANVAERVGAAATFHGGGLVTGKTDSPHFEIPQMKAEFLVAIAANDDEKEPEAKDVLREAFGKARLRAEIEVYAGTKHGWCPPDSPVYDHDAAEKAWGRLLALFKRALQA